MSSGGPGVKTIPVVALRNVAKRYGWGGRWVLESVDLEVPPARVIEVRGVNGSGKSTLLRLLAGASRPSRGARSTAGGLTVGYAPDDIEPPPFSGAAYLRHHVRLRAARGGDAGAMSGEVVGLAERLECVELLGEPMSSLSRGTRQKVVLIQALLGAPRLLVLDEPFAGLDARAQGTLCSIVEERRAKGATVLVSDHRQGGERPRADAVWELAGGTVHEIDAVGAGG